MLQVKVEDGKVHVTINKSVSAGRLKRIKLSHCVLSFCVKIHNFKNLFIFPQVLKSTKRVKEMCSRVPDIKHTILLIGGGNKYRSFHLKVEASCYQSFFLSASTVFSP